MADDASADLSTLTADIVSAYVANNEVKADKLADIIGSVHQALATAGQPVPAVEDVPKPDKAAVKKSISGDYLISFLDGRKYKSLKRHLTGAGLTPGEYRERFGLDSSYPMVAPNYSAQRSALAKTLGLGRKAAAAAPAPEAEAASEPEAPPKKGRGKAKAAAA